MAKGQDVGNMQFGGSTVVLLTQPGIPLQWVRGAQNLRATEERGMESLEAFLLKYPPSVLGNDVVPEDIFG